MEVPPESSMVLDKNDSRARGCRSFFVWTGRAGPSGCPSPTEHGGIIWGIGTICDLIERARGLNGDENSQEHLSGLMTGD